jgi:DNA polymerase-3 subunit gamma/tau
MAQRCSNPFLYKAIDLANECDLNYRLSKNKRLLIELTLIRLCQLSDNPVPPIDNKPKEEIKPIQSAPPPVAQAAPQTSAPQATVVPKSPTQAAAPAPDPVIKKSFPSSGMGVSLASLQNNEKEITEEKAAEEKKNRASKFSENELINAWKEYAEGLKEEKLVQNSMTFYLPKMLGETLFEVEVNTEINKQYLTDNSLSILTFLREKLQNDDITMTIKVSEKQMIMKSSSPREIFHDFVEINPSLQKLANELNLELG